MDKNIVPVWNLCISYYITYRDDMKTNIGAACKYYIANVGPKIIV
jgi:hypothetical protein